MAITNIYNLYNIYNCWGEPWSNSPCILQVLFILSQPSVGEATQLHRPLCSPVYFAFPPCSTKALFQKMVSITHAFEQCLMPPVKHSLLHRIR